MLRNTDVTALDRRDFLRLSVGASSGLLLGTMLPASAAFADAAPAAATTSFNPFVQISPDNVVTVIVKHLDKGQGAATGLATLVADELDASWDQITTEFAPANTAVYKNLAFGAQGTGGSTAMANAHKQYREAGAAARIMIIEAAAKRWGIAKDEITVSGGVVSGGGKTAKLGDLAADAAKMPVPKEPPLKTPDKFVYIGKKFPRIDSKPKTIGAPIFTQDMHPEGLIFAVMARSPKFGGKVKSFDDKAARAVAGVTDVIKIDTGVAVLANSTYAAMSGRDALDITWDNSDAETRSSDQLLKEYKELADKPGTLARKADAAEAELAKADKVIEATYVFPFLAHAPMEPMNCVIKADDKTAEVWTGSQLQTVDQQVVAEILALDIDDVKIHTLWAGGSFGRRAVYNSDYVAETASIARASNITGPIKLVWTREDDIKGGYYRPMYVHKVRAGIDKDGKIVAWHHRIVGQSILTGTPFEAMLVKDGIDVSSVEGVSDTKYDIPNLHLELHSVKAGPPPLWWRAVGHTHTAYVMETMIDEVAAAAGKDPVAYRMELLAKHPRHLGVLKLAAEKAGWPRAEKKGTGFGVAIHESFNSVVAEVVDVTMDGDRPKVGRVVTAVDCGLAINPDNIASQIEGGIGFGLGAVLHSKITLADGEPEQGNFDTYEVLRMSEMPKVEVHIVPSDADPTGVGEPGTPPIGPAVANAVAQLTGQRVRVLPFRDGLKLG